MRKPVLIPLIALAALLSGCLFDTGPKLASGGAQDFPNTITLGEAVSSNIMEHSTWDQFSVIPNTLPSVSSTDSMITAPESLKAAPKALGKALGKSAATAAISDTVFWDFSDTATFKVVRRIHQQETLFKIIGDTLVIRWDDKAKDPIIGNELILASKGATAWKGGDRRTTYHYMNTDSAGGFDKAVFTERIPAILPAGDRLRVLVMLPGKDGSFDKSADNVPAFYAYARTATQAGLPDDTLESFSVTDADGDGALWGDGDSGAVDFHQKTPNPALRPSVVLVTQTMRAILFKDSLRTYPISYHEIRTEKDGKKVTFSVHGTRDGADSTFDPGDTVAVVVDVDFPDGASVSEKRSRYTVVLGGQPKHYSDNKLIRYSLMEAWRKDIDTTRFTFTPDAPVQSQELSITGALDLSVDFSNGDHGDADGTFENKVIDVNLANKEKAGKLHHFHIQWDEVGKVLKQIALD